MTKGQEERELNNVKEVLKECYEQTDCILFVSEATQKCDLCNTYTDRKLGYTVKIDILSHEAGEEIKNITINAIKQLPLYTVIMDRIKNRAQLGYNYVILDMEFMNVEVLNKYRITDFNKIYKYLEDIGFTIHTIYSKDSEWKIAWSLK